MGVGIQPQQEHFAIYTLIYVWKQYFQLLNWHKIVTYIIILTFILKTAIFIINWFLFDTTCHCAERPPSAAPYEGKEMTLIKYEGKETKISVFKLFSELGKIWKYNLGFSKIIISHLFYELAKTSKYTQSQTNISKFQCWIYGWVGKTYVLISASLLKIRWIIHIKEDHHISNLK